MTRMLASVSSCTEAIEVADCADVIDLKDPHAGTLGALEPERVHEVVAWGAGRYLISAALGELVPGDGAIAASSAAACAVLDATGVDFVKIGLRAGHPAFADALEALREATRRAALVAVLYADCHPDASLVDAAAAAGFAGVMLDTAGKDGGHLFDHCTERAARAFVERAHARGLFAGLAGSLTMASVPRALGCAPDYLGFRGALCEGSDRLGKVSRERALALSRAVRDAGLPAAPVRAAAPAAQEPAEVAR